MSNTRLLPNLLSVLQPGTYSFLSVTASCPKFLILHVGSRIALVVQKCQGFDVRGVRCDFTVIEMKLFLFLKLQVKLLISEICAYIYCSIIYHKICKIAQISTELTEIFQSTHQLLNSKNKHKRQRQVSYGCRCWATGNACSISQLQIERLSLVLKSLFISVNMCVIVKFNLSIMLNLKQKQNYEPSFVEHLSSLDSKFKNKKNHEPSSKSHKNLVKDPTIIPIKRKNHQPSKSTIENVEHIHYNSPNFELAHNVTHTNQNFTFTHILQQHNNQQKSNIASRSGQPNNLSLLHSYNDESYSNNRQDKSVKNKDGGMLFSQVMGQGLSVSEQQFSNALHSKLRAINLNDSRQIDVSVEKENRKSPLRVVNTNKLNNTPKIKEKNSKKMKQTQKAQNKTFAALINSNLTAEKSLTEQINLQCSQKIQKLMKIQPGLTWQKIKFQQKFNDGRNKSNLLSTGLINLSLPSQQTNQTKPKLSKQTISKLIIEHIISEEKVRSFSESDSQKKVDLSQRIRAIKQKAEEVAKKMSQKNQEDGYLRFVAEIKSNFNPEMLEKGCFEQICQLQKLKKKVSMIVQDSIQKLKQLKTKLCSDIQGQIKLIKTSVQSKINWVAISSSLDIADQTETIILKNEWLISRIKSVEQEIYENNSLNEIVEENGSRFFAQISSIESAVQEIRLKVFAKEKQTKCPKNLHGIDFESVIERVEVYWQKIQKLEKAVQMFF